MTLYDDLGVTPEATPAEIKAAARRAQKTHHPDAGGTTEGFQKVQRAVAILSDPAKKEHYDRTGEERLTSDPEAEEQREAEALLIQAMAAVLQNAMLDPAHTDVAEMVRSHVAQHLRGLDNQRVEFDAHAKRCAKFLKRLKVKKDAPDPVGNLLRQQQTEVAKAKVETERRIRIAKRAKAMAATYGYEVDPQESPFAQMRSAGLGGLYRNPGF